MWRGYTEGVHAGVSRGVCGGGTCRGYTEGVCRGVHIVNIGCP